MKKTVKILIIVSVILLFLCALAFGAYTLTYDKYGFLFPLADDEYYDLEHGYYEKIDNVIHCTPSIPPSASMRYDSSRLYDALKNATYTKTNYSDLHYGERVGVCIDKDNKPSKLLFALYHDRVSQKVYLKWNDIIYEVAEFDKAREAIQECLYHYIPSINFAIAGSKFCSADFFSLPDPHTMTLYDGYKNTEAVVLNSDSDIIAHAQKEVREGYDEVRVSHEQYGDRIMVRFDYRFKEENLYKTIHVIMSKDGITELIVNKAGFMAGCI